jgi:putative CocE/NonD family hydrolase
MCAEQNQLPPAMKLLQMLLVWVAVLPTLTAAEGWPRRSKSDVEFRWGVKVPMRDGIRLSGTLYTPGDQDKPAPCLFTLTPYVADTYHGTAKYFAAHGFPFFVVDMRGRGNSEGDFHPLSSEARDGYDVVEWLAAQPYCNGKVGMWGYSYGGYVQWAVAKELPPHLTTLVPAAATYPGFGFPMRNNIFYPIEMVWIVLTSGHTAQDTLLADRPFWEGIERRWSESGASLRALDRFFGEPSPIWQEWLSHPYQDAYWDASIPAPKGYARLSIPILTVTGSYDYMQAGALEFYRQHLRYGHAAAEASHYLIIGPWDHEGTYVPRPQFGGLKFGPANLVDLPGLQIQWYAWTMQNGPRPEFLRDRVAYYVMGADKWRYARSLRAVTAYSDPYYLGSSVISSDGGSLTREPLKSGSTDQYRYDPGQVSGQKLTDPESWITQGETYSSDSKRLIYQSSRFERDTELSGFFKLAVWLSIDQPDTDFSASVYEIAADGSSILLASDVLRARYRTSLREARLVPANEALRYDFDHFNFVSRLIKRGSRLRLVLGPVTSFSGLDAYSEKNYNGGGVVADESAKDSRAVTVKLYHDRAHPSALYIPVGTAQTVDEPTAPASAFSSIQ